MDLTLATLVDLTGTKHLDVDHWCMRCNKLVVESMPRTFSRECLENFVDR